MPFPMRIQPIDSQTPEESFRYEPVKPPAKWRFRRLFERQFPGVLKVSAVPEKESQSNKDGSGGGEFEPSSVCLANMVQNFIEDSNSNEKPAAGIRCGRRRCNCFNGKCSDESEDDCDFFQTSLHGFGDSNLLASGEACEILKSLVPCASVAERNLLADAARIVEKHKISKRKDNFSRKVLTEGLVALGYDASICKSRWEKSPSYPAGEYEYVDVIVEKERLLIDIDFRSEFEIARSTKNYKAVLQALPHIFVGKPDRLQKIISVATEAAKQSLKKKGMHFPPWRRAEYVKAKWLSPYTRNSCSIQQQQEPPNLEEPEKKQPPQPSRAIGRSPGSKLEDEAEDYGDGVFSFSADEEEESAVEVEVEVVVVVTGLASVIQEKQP